MTGHLPALHRRLLDLAAITPEQVTALSSKLSVATLSDLQAVLEDGRARRALGADAAQSLSKAAAFIAAERRPVPLGRALDLLDTVRAILLHDCPQLRDVVPAGDARRFEPLVAELILVAKAEDPSAAIDMLCASPGIDQILYRTTRRAVVAVQQVEIDIRVAATDEYGAVLFAATGAAVHTQAVLKRRGRRTVSASEEDVYREAGLAWIPAEMRNGTGEIDAAAGSALPRLIEVGDIRGDLHLHTTYSDGQDTLESMVAAASALRYDYIAITDHSANAAASRTVALDQLPRQRDEIARIRERYPQITILHGIEVDILRDGRLDFSDAVLQQLDIVLASLHDSAGQDGAALTRRCLQAIDHPLVNVITHPANRLVGRRGGYPLDFAAIYAAAAATGTALEVDGAPSHLDMDGEHARAAVAAGVTIVIDSDCHRARLLARQMALGVGTARRGWVEKRHVLNARPLPAVRAFIEAKRQR